MHHLTSFFSHIQTDKTVTPVHISLYISIYQLWQKNNYINPIQASRSTLMKLSRINANSTYHKTIKHLQERGYIQYQPSYNPFTGSTIHLLPLETQSKQ